jgi:hypothetical protein
MIQLLRRTTMHTRMPDIASIKLPVAPGVRWAVRIGRIVADFPAKECRNFFRHSGYAQI